MTKTIDRVVANCDASLRESWGIKRSGKDIVWSKRQYFSRDIIRDYLRIPYN